MVLASQEIVNTPVCYSNQGICALLTQPIRRYIEKTVCRFPRDCTYSAAKLPSWLESILIIVTVFIGDQVIESRQDQPEWLWRASCRAAYELQELKKKKKKLVPDIYPLPFMSCILALVGCTQSNEGSPSGMWVHLQAWDCLCMIYRLYVATSAKIISFETNCCKLQNPAPIITSCTNLDP